MQFKASQRLNAEGIRGCFQGCSSGGCLRSETPRPKAKPHYALAPEHCFDGKGGVQKMVLSRILLHQWLENFLFNFSKY